ncbi:unnamed protein product [Pylaiella littoralis]
MKRGQLLARGRCTHQDLQNVHATFCGIEADVKHAAVIARESGANFAAEGKRQLISVGAGARPALKPACAAMSGAGRGFRTRSRRKLWQTLKTVATEKPAWLTHGIQNARRVEMAEREMTLLFSQLPWTQQRTRPDKSPLKVRVGLARGGGVGRRRGGPPAIEKLPLAGMTLLKLAIIALLVGYPSTAFVVVTPPAVASGVCSVYDVPAVTGTTGLARESTSTSRRIRRSRRSRSSRRNVSCVIGSSRTSENNVSLADGLTTSSTETQNGGGEGQGSSVPLNSGTFVPAPGTVSLEAALTRSPHFRDILSGVESNRKGQQSGLLHTFEPMERVVLTANGNLQRMMSSYYNSPVTVDIKYCREVEPSVYEREVEISIFGRVFCRAKSLVVSPRRFFRRDKQRLGCCCPVMCIEELFSVVLMADHVPRWMLQSPNNTSI